MSTLPQRTGPLIGLKVLEIGHYIAAPFCTRILADLGAEVIKIEPPGGDPFRGWGAAVNGNSVWFSVHGRNKLSVVLDLKRDRDIVLRLAARADVLVENLRAGGLERLGLGPDALHAANPRLVIARISGYGQDGPYRDKPAFGAIGEAIGGIRHLTAHPAGSSDLPPPRCGISISDDLAGMYAAIGLLVGAVAARCRRDRTGARDRREPGRFRVQPDGRNAPGIRNGWPRPPAGRCRDRNRGAHQHVSLRRWQMALHCRQLGPDLCPPDGGNRPAELAGDPAFATNADRCAHRAALDAAIAAWTRALPAKEAEARLEAADVPCSRLYDIADCANDPHFLARGSVQTVDDPLIGRTLHPGPAIRLDGDPPEATIGWPGPAAGAHTDYVLRTLLGLQELANALRQRPRDGHGP